MIVLALHAVWSLVAEYVPVPHAVQVASADDEPIAKPSPAGQAFADHTTHGFASMSALKEPLAQVEQELSVVVLPAVNPSVALHVVSENERHAPVLSPALNVSPETQLEHVESAEALPAPYPLPATHFVNVHALQNAPPVSHVPVAHALAHAALLLAVPAVNAAPAGHVRVEYAVHAVWSSVAENVPVLHAVQVASADDEPAA